MHCFVPCATAIAMLSKLCSSSLLNMHYAEIVLQGLDFHPLHGEMACYIIRSTCFSTVRSNLIWYAVGVKFHQSGAFTFPIFCLCDAACVICTATAVFDQTSFKEPILCASNVHIISESILKSSVSNCSKLKSRTIIQCKYCSICKWFMCMLGELHASSEKSALVCVHIRTFPFERISNQCLSDQKIEWFSHRSPNCEAYNNIGLFE